MQTFDTICALSTAPGMGAIALIRISGSNAFDIVSQLGKKDLRNAASHSAHFARIRKADDSILDEVVITLFDDNKSFTGEKTAEIACHGSVFIQQEILKLVLSKGCRMAEPGEFTMRAFLNGKMDLSQAEAVADLISSQSSKAHEIAMNQMRGGFSKELSELREKLINFASLVELELDFAEEDVEFADRKELLALVTEVLAYVRRLIKSFDLGNVIKNGVPVAIVGAPNTGKSTLLNQLLGEERAIVSNIAGTTRDVIEETLNIDGILFRLIDTAGIREHAEEIEAIGIERSHQKIEQAKVVLLLSDFSAPGSSFQEIEAWSEQLKTDFPEKHLFVLANKMDIEGNEVQTNKWNSSVSLLKLSAKSGEGVSDLKTSLLKAVEGDFNSGQETIVSNVRHLEALNKTEESLVKALFGLETNVTGDFVAMDIRQAMFELGTITADISTEDLLGNIFSKFCIGK